VVFVARRPPLPVPDLGGVRTVTPTIGSVFRN
jgi:hypothetical protein